MVVQITKAILISSMFLLSGSISSSQAALDGRYYYQTCPQAENTVVQTIRNASIYDPKVPARILRMFFHDCFIRGCDASILLDSKPDKKAEKDGPPNVSVRAFYVTDEAKAKLEKACPQTVSCADIIAMAARDAVTMTGGPYWTVLKGRKDGRSFAKRRLGIKDLVALSGGHSLGFSHCSSFEARLHNFSTIHDADPRMNSRAKEKKCPKPNKARTAGHFLDSTASRFDNAYYKGLMAGRGVFGTDQALYDDPTTGWMVESFAKDQNLFSREFAASMIKLGNVRVSDSGEVRLNCRKVN
ncbi:hypothetical protein Cgig2_030014 [Carnegiea gigantea]|uniref:Peroxidase n=1 Tax=Carnegiea gigantea TaxID=171969 RepID=A0A9Q1K7Z2_9CARY|nr:hypothetical protein Cgig2_030014 [Carnegiea gigantea]